MEPQARIDALIANKANSAEPWFSFEFFPPKTEKGVESLKKVIGILKEYNPLFVDFTWGAGGTTSDLTFDLCRQVKEEFDLVANMHLTCTNMDVEKIDKALNDCRSVGLRNILALRGDPPVGQEKWTAADAALNCAHDLTRYIREQHGDYFTIAVAGYPEGHPAAMTEISPIPEDLNAELTASEMKRYSHGSKVITAGVAATETTEAVDEVTEPCINICRDDDFMKEMKYLKEKMDSGATFVITQMFFDVEIYGTFVDACHEYGITIPIVPGIMCIASYAGFKRMIKFCKTRVAQSVADRMEELKDDAAAVKAYGVELGISMCKRLKELGAPGYHFYTLNTSPVTIAILEGLGYAKQAPQTVFAAVENA